MEAFGIVRIGIDSSRARRTRSVCVVALSPSATPFHRRIRHTQTDPPRPKTQRPQSARRAISRHCSTRPSRGPRASHSGHSIAPTAPGAKSQHFSSNGRILAYQCRLVDEEDARVGLEVDARRFSHYVQAFDCDVCFVGEAEAYEVEHFAWSCGGEMDEVLCDGGVQIWACGFGGGARAI